MIDKLIKLTTLLGTFIVFNGVVYLSIFYHHFDINIFSYLEFTEVITAFLDSLESILIFFGIYLFQQFITVLLLTKEIKEISNASLDNYTQKSNDKKMSDLSKQMKITVWVQISILSLLTILILFKIIEFSKWTIYIYCFVILNIFQTVIHSIDSLLEILVGKKYMDAVFLFLLFILPFTTYTIALANYDSFTKENNTKEIQLVDKDKNIISLDRDFKFIGKTNKFIFLYNFKTNKSMSISLSNIDIISLGSS